VGDRLRLHHVDLDPNPFHRVRGIWHRLDTFIWVLVNILYFYRLMYLGGPSILRRLCGELLSTTPKNLIGDCQKLQVAPKRGRTRLIPVLFDVQISLNFVILRPMSRSLNGNSAINSSLPI
jgi:hypothetical protein